MKLDFIKEYYQTILLIIEDRPKYEIPVNFYKTLIFVSYLQILIYLISPNESKIIDDLKMQAVAQISQMISLRNILAVKNSDTFSLIVYILIQVFMYSYFIYVGVLALISHHMQSFYENYKKIFVQINQILNMYFALFIQIFFTQYVEMNASILFCSQRSLFISNRVTSTNQTCQLASYQPFIGSIGLVLTLFTAWITTYFFRNYEFLEFNLIKRKMSNMFQIIIALKFILSIVYYANSSSEQFVKHVLSHAIGIVSIVDFFLNYPYSDTRVGKFYLKVISWYYSLTIMSHVWIYTNQISSYELFYYSLLIGVLAEYFLQSLNNYRYDQYLVTEVRPNYIPSKLDFFLEEIVRLAQESIKDELSKAKLFKIIKSHQQSCQNSDCNCNLLNQFLQGQNHVIKANKQNKKQEAKESQTLISNDSFRAINASSVQQSQKLKTSKNQENNEEQESDFDLNFEQILQIIDSIFKYFLSQQVIKKNQVEYEHLSLKYITFMIKYLKNYTRSNYELKLLQFQREDFSSYFKMISQIISKKIEGVISQINIQLELRRKDEITVRQLMVVNGVIELYIPQIYKIMTEKQKLWTSLQKGYRNMNQFQNEAIKLMRIVRNTRNQFLKDMRSLDRQYKLNQCLHFQKLYLIFYLFVMNDNIRAYELETLVQDLRKRDSLKEVDTLSNENYLRENIINLTMSLSQSLGKIVSKKDEKTASFFSYSKQNFLKIQKVNELMPSFFSRSHDKILKQFVKRGESQYIKSSKFVFARDQRGFVFPVKLYLDFSFTVQNDFQVNGTLLKVNQANDYILFHRSGKIVGLTSKIASLLMSQTTQGGSKLPSGDFISQNLHAHLLLPKICKRIFKQKDQILQNLRSDGDILIQDKKGQIIISSNPLMQMKRLQTYSLKMNSTGQDKRSRQNVKNTEFEKLDLFNENSFDLVNSFLRQDIDASSAGGLSSGRQSGKHSNKSFVSKQSTLGNKRQKYRIRFNYTLNFSCISTQLNQEQDLFFSLKMNDINATKVKEKQRSYFRVNLCTYLLSTCIANKVCQRKSQAQGQNVNENNPLHSVSQTLNEWTFTDDDIPTRLVKLAVLNDNQIQALNSVKQKQHKEVNKSLELDDQDNQNKAINSDNSDDDDDNNDYTDQEDEDDAYNINLLKYKKKIIDYYEEKAKNDELNKVLTDHNIMDKEVLKIDPNFKVKKVIQFKSFSSTFGRAFETALVEALLEYEEEKNLFLDSQVADDYQLNNEEATFRGYNTANEAVLKPQQIFLMEKKNNTNSNNVNKLIQQSISLYDQSPLSAQNKLQDKNINLIQKQIDNSIYDNSVNDLSNLPSFNVNINNQNDQIDLSSFNLQQQNKNAKYFDQSSRPFFKQQEELNVNDNEILMTPSVEDHQRYIQESNAETYQLALEKKEVKKYSQLEASTTNQMNSTLGPKYKDQNQGNVTKSQKNNSKLFAKQNFENQQNQQSNIGKNEQKQLVPSQLRSDQTKENDEAIDDESGKAHQKVVIKLLNQKGLVGVESINKGSIHSSSKSSQSYGGNFLKDIIQMCKIPKNSYHYSSLLIFFVVVFFTLNITNLMIIENDIQTFSSNVVVLRQPRKFLRSYSKVLYGRLIQYEIQANSLNDPTGKIMNVTNFYISDGLKEYYSLVQQYNPTMMQYLQQMQSTMNDTSRAVQIYQDLNGYEQDIDFTLIMAYNLNFLYGAQSNSTNIKIKDCYLYLRQNYFQFSTDIMNFGDYLVTNALQTVDNLILKFTIIAVCAIVGVIFVALISLPILRLINSYEEKIMMIVSRINYDNSQIEKLKLNVCQQLIDIDQYDWLKYNFSDIISLRFDQFDANVVNSQHDLTKTTNSKKDSDKAAISNLLKMQQEINKSEYQQNDQVNQQKDHEQSKVKKKNHRKVYNDGGSSYKEYQMNIRNNINKNYVLQSKIINQKLSVFQRFLPLLGLTICNTIYFLVIIIYLQSSKDQLKIPVQMNQRTIRNHISQSTMKISQELLTFDFLVQKMIQGKESNDLHQYQLKLNDMIDISSSAITNNTALVYGSNPFPTSILNKFKDFEQGNICQYLVKFNCTQSVVGNKYASNFILQTQLKVIYSYPDVITEKDAPIDLLIAYSNSNDHFETFIQSFLIYDEAIDLYSSSVNTSIGTISTQVQTFLEQYLQIFGNIFGVCIVIICYLSWINLYQRIQSMNLLLTFIPEEKLLEEVTLQMLKSLIRM
ncbi:hypothetical protein ABPG74_010037 [Tetrahymena malaccensis]